MQDDVSVLMPVAPRARWLFEATESLLAQTHRAWTLIAVLDGDCEQNRAVLERRELRGRVRIAVLPAGSGVAIALNAGLAGSGTALVARLDADDVCEPDRLAAQLAEFRRRPELLVLGSCATLIDRDGRRTGERLVPVGVDRVRRSLRWRNSVLHPSAVYRRDAVVEAGGYDDRCPRSEDYHLWLRLAARGQVDNLAAPLLRYRLHSGQHSRPVTGAATTPIRVARRALSRTPLLGPACADLRHLAWLSYQHVQARRPARRTGEGV